MALLHRRDAGRNLARFYALSVERSLFGDYLLVRVWGRIGKRGQSRSDWFSSSAAATTAAARLADRKRRRGYQDVIAWESSATASSPSPARSHPERGWGPQPSCARRGSLTIDPSP